MGGQGETSIPFNFTEVEGIIKTKSTKLLWLNWLLLCKFHITPQHWNCTSISNSPQRKTRISWPYHYVVNIMHADDWLCKDQHELWTGLNCPCFHRIILALHNKGFNFHFTSMLWFPYIFSCVAIYIYIYSYSGGVLRLRFYTKWSTCQQSSPRGCCNLRGRKSFQNPSINSNFAKTCLRITVFSVVQLFWNFAHSMAVPLPCSVQNFKTIELLK